MTKAQNTFPLMIDGNSFQSKLNLTDWKIKSKFEILILKKGEWMPFLVVSLIHCKDKNKPHIFILQTDESESNIVSFLLSAGIFTSATATDKNRYRVKVDEKAMYAYAE